MRYSIGVCGSFAAITLAATGVFAAPEDQDVFEDFEGFIPNTTTDFEIGSAIDGTATFGGDAFAGVAGIGELYRPGGVRAWMVSPTGTGTIDFGDTNAATVEFWTRLRTGADGSTVYTAFDDASGVIDTVTIDTPGAFQLLSFSGDIDRITVVNNATGTGQMNSIDDFGFTTVPEPSSVVLLGLGALALVARRRRSDA